MSITIIKMGRQEKQANAPIRFQCQHCQCEYTATPPDYAPVSDQRDGDYWQSKCPSCNFPVTKAMK